MEVCSCSLYKNLCNSQKRTSLLHILHFHYGSIFHTPGTEPKNFPLESSENFTSQANRLHRSLLRSKFPQWYGEIRRIRWNRRMIVWCAWFFRWVICYTCHLLSWSSSTWDLPPRILFCHTSEIPGQSSKLPSDVRPFSLILPLPSICLINSWR